MPDHFSDDGNSVSEVSPVWDDYPDNNPSTAPSPVFDSVCATVCTILGILCLSFSIYYLVNHEMSAANDQTALKSGEQTVSELSATNGTSLDGKLVHFSGQANPDKPIKDPDTGFSAKGLQLSRKVEICAWKEEQTTEYRSRWSGGRDMITTYKYKLDWQENPAPSSSFRNQEGHKNPILIALKSKKLSADRVTIGQYLVPASLIDSLPASQSLKVTACAAKNLEQSLKRKAHVERGVVYFSATPKTPSVGDLRISYSLVPAGEISLVAGRQKNSFVPFVGAHAQSQVFIVKPGMVKAAQMFKQVEAEEKHNIVMVRCLASFLILLGFGLLYAPMQALIEAHPIFGQLFAGSVVPLVLVASCLLVGSIATFCWLRVDPHFALVAFGIAASASLATILLCKFMPGNAAAEAIRQPGL